MIISTLKGPANRSESVIIESAIEIDMLNLASIKRRAAIQKLTNEFVPQVLGLDVMLKAGSHHVDAVVVARPKPGESLAGWARVHLLDGL